MAPKRLSSTWSRWTAEGRDGLRALPIVEARQQGNAKQTIRMLIVAEVAAQAKFVTEGLPDCRVHPHTSKGYANVLSRE